MRTILQMGFQSFEVLEWDESKTGNVILQFRDRFSALDFLRYFLHDPLGMMNIRNLLGKTSPYGDISRLSDHQVLEQLAWQLVSGRLRIAELPVFEIAVSGEEPFREPPEPKPQVVLEKKTSWIEIQLLGMDNEPIANERYEITLPDGKSVAEGRLDKNGFARKTGLEEGTCKVCFPDLDKEVWEKV